MRCFSMHNLRKKYSGAEQEGSLEGYGVPEAADEEDSSLPTTAPACSSARMSFRRRVLAIQNAQRFINSNPKLRSSHPSYASKESRKYTPDAFSPLLPLGGRQACSASELGSGLSDVATAYNRHGIRLESTLASKPCASAAHLPCLVDDTCTNALFAQPLPSPTRVSQSLQKVAQPCSAYRLPLPSENACNPPIHANLPQLNRTQSKSSETTCMHPAMLLPLTSNRSKLSLGAMPPSLPSTTVCNHMQNGANPLPCQRTDQLQNDTDIVRSTIPDGIVNTDRLTSELQSFPPLNIDTQATSPLRSFKYEELSFACQNFSPDHCIKDAHLCFYGTIKVKGNWITGKHKDVVVLRLNEPHQQGLQEWISKLSMVALEVQRQSSHVCKLVGFYGEEGCAERMLVYERLKKGALSSLLYETLNVPPLDWAARMKIAYDTAQGLSRLHEKFPNDVLYSDFRTSHVQVDHDHSSKISLYRFVNPIYVESQTISNDPRVKACRAPETVNQGELRLKSNVWSFGVVLLELLSGRQHMDEGMMKKERRNLVKWAKPFLSNEGKLFLLMDPKLQGKFPAREAKMVADLALVCLKRDPTKRPSMREALDVLRDVQDSTYTAQSTKPKEVSFSSLASLPFSGSPSVVPTSLTNQQRPSSLMTPSKFDVVEGPPLKPLIIPPRCCGEGIVSNNQQDYSPVPLAHVKF